MPSNSNTHIESDIADTGLYDTKTAAIIIGLSPVTVRNARLSGVLGGVEAPAFIKMGKSVRYKGNTLKAWLAQFKEQVKTGEHTAKADEL